KHGQGEEQVRRLETLESGTPEQVVTLLTEEAAPGGLTRFELVARSQLPPEVVDEALETGAGVVARRFGPGAVELFIARSAVEEFERKALAALEQRQKDSPAEPTLSADELAKLTGLGPASREFSALSNGLLEQGKAALKENRFMLAAAEARLSESQKNALDAMERILAESALAPPGVPELGKAAGAKPQELKLLLKMLEGEGKAVKVKPDLYFSSEAVEQARVAIVERCQEAGQITLAEFRDILGVSRKFAQALLEYFDRAGLTRRIEDYRVLRKKGTA
ncbi:MAG: SelB C-terminal domain-containing protein, partial [Pseudomonadota bacterium]